MVNLPTDIDRKIDELFTSSPDRQYVRKIMLDLWTTSINVGPDQLARSILTLSEGEVEKIKIIVNHDFYGDPRDVIMMAERKVGNPKHYFIPTFDEIETGKLKIENKNRKE